MYLEDSFAVHPFGFVLIPCEFASLPSQGQRPTKERSVHYDSFSPSIFIPTPSPFLAKAQNQEKLLKRSSYPNNFYVLVSISHSVKELSQKLNFSSVFSVWRRILFILFPYFLTLFLVCVLLLILMFPSTEPSLILNLFVISNFTSVLFLKMIPLIFFLLLNIVPRIFLF